MRMTRNTVPGFIQNLAWLILSRSVLLAQIICHDDTRNYKSRENQQLKHGTKAAEMRAQRLLNLQSQDENEEMDFESSLVSASGGKVGPLKVVSMHTVVLWEDCCCMRVAVAMPLYIYITSSVACKQSMNIVP